METNIPQINPLGMDLADMYHRRTELTDLLVLQYLLVQEL